jgi:hypothetical protein
MRLDDARLCLDCEEIHQDQECPGCGSEAFAFLTRWIQSTTRDTTEKARPSKRPVPAKATPATSRPTPSRDELDAWRRIVDGEPAPAGTGRKVLTRGLMGLAAAGVAGWIWSRGGGKGTDDDAAT